MKKVLKLLKDLLKLHNPKNKKVSASLISQILVDIIFIYNPNKKEHENKKLPNICACRV